MQKHVKIYMDFFDYGEQDFMPCEWCGKRLNDCHHINGRGKGKDVIENLVGLCRECHLKCHSSKEFNKQVEQKHLKIIK